MAWNFANTQKSLRSTAKLASLLAGISLAGVGLEARAQNAPARTGFSLPQNQIDVAGGFAFGAQAMPYMVGGGMESMAPGNGPYGEITYHRGFGDHLVAWGVVSFTDFNRGSPGVFGSTQTARLWDNKLVLGWKDECASFHGLIYEYYGGVKYVGLDLNSRSATGAWHTGSFSGFGPTIGLTLDYPIIPVGPDGRGGLMFNSYFEGAALFGSMHDSSSYGVSGNSSRTVFYTGEMVGLSTNAAPNITITTGLTARQYYGITDKNLNLGGTSASNNFYSFTGALGAKIRF